MDAKSTFCTLFLMLDSMRRGTGALLVSQGFPRSAVRRPEALELHRVDRPSVGSMNIIT